MIANLDDLTVQLKISTELADHDILNAVLEATKKCELEFRVDSDASGIEFVATNEVKGAPNRGRMKIFFPAGKKLVAMFYKKSAVPYSRDRFSYGGVQAMPTTVLNADIPSWLTYLHSGFHPEKRPSKLQPTLPYTLPD